MTQSGNEEYVKGMESLIDGLEKKPATSNLINGTDC